MKINSILKSTLLILTTTASVLPTALYADVQSSTDPVKIKSFVLYHASRGKSLADTLAQVAQRSGIIFKINADLGQDVVSQTIDAESWNIAVRALLANYNFATIQESNMIKTVIVSGRNKGPDDDSVADSTTVASAEDVVRIDQPMSVMQIEREWSND